MSYGFKMLKRPICEDIPRFPPGHAWMEPLHHFWRRVADLLACDGPEGHGSTVPGGAIGCRKWGKWDMNITWI